jgi:ribosome maturation factor RimP
MIKAEQIRALLRDELLHRDLFLVDVFVNPGNRIVVYVDSMRGVSIEECIAVSRYIGSRLDREAEDFELEVSSPGLDNPLKLPQQYLKNLGRMLEVVTFDGVKTRGKLIGADEENIRLEVESLKKDGKGKKKVKETQTWEKSMKEVKTAKVVISIK